MEKVCTSASIGSFGYVYKIRRKSDSKILVWKELNYGRMTEKEKQQLVSEVNILKDLSHPNIVRYYDRIIDKQKGKIYIVMEYCEGGDMGQLIKKCKRNNDYIAEDVVWKIFMQLALALRECHHRAQRKILHRDIKPGNIFLDASTNVKIGDFGLSRVLSDESQYAFTHVGTPYYMSPEQMVDAKYNEKSDIWSAGCVLYEIAALKPPFQAGSQFSLAAKIRAGRFERLPLRYSEELQKVLECMLRIEPEKRSDIEEILKVPQIALRVDEKNLKDKYYSLKKKEELLAKREQKIAEVEKRLEEEKQQIKLKEKEFMQLEASLLKGSPLMSDKENYNAMNVDRTFECNLANQLKKAATYKRMKIFDTGKRYITAQKCRDHNAFEVKRYQE